MTIHIDFFKNEESHLRLHLATKGIKLEDFELIRYEDDTYDLVRITVSANGGKFYCAVRADDYNREQVIASLVIEKENC